MRMKVIQNGVLTDATEIVVGGFYLWTSREGYSLPGGQRVQVYRICEETGLVCFNTFPNEYDEVGASYCKSPEELSGLPDGHVAAQENHDLKVELARGVLSRARAAMGHDLFGFSVVDLLADNFPWSLEQCRQIARDLS